MSSRLSVEDRLRRGERLIDLTRDGVRRAAVMEVLARHGWDLDPHGRLPFRLRITTPPGLRDLQPGSLIVRPQAEREPPTPRKRAPRKASAPAERKPQGFGARGAVRQHGSPAGYSQHYRLNDLPVCQPCKDAWNQMTAERRAGRAEKAS